MTLYYFGKLLWIVSFTFSVASARTGNRKQRNFGTEIRLLNVDKVWKENITGRKVVVAVVDDGFNFDHVDLRQNYKPQTSRDFVDDDGDPGPVLSGHGTKCAGIIAGKINAKCKTGIAYNAEIGGLRIFNESKATTDLQEAAAFRFESDLIDIYSNSWGPLDSGYIIRGPGPKAIKALEDGAKKGRKGRGSIFVFSSGNGGVLGDSCAFDGYVNSIYTIAIGAVTTDGRIPRYAESCGSIMASTFGDNVVTCSGSSDTTCVLDFGRTSAAAAMASGVIALALEANEKLTWRDVQHLIVRTSDQKYVKIDGKEWTVNGAGLMVHQSIGFGIMNAKKLVDTARNWTNVPSRISCSIVLTESKGKTIPYNKYLKFDMRSAWNRNCSKIRNIEHVEVKLSLEFSPRAFMLMYLKSPTGTTSQFLYQRLFDAMSRKQKYDKLVVSSLHYWGEDPNGNWEISFKSSSAWSKKKGKLSKFEMNFYGTEKDPLSDNRGILPSGKIKCGKKLFWIGYGEKCCGSSVTYDPNRYECCKTHEVVERSAKCGKKPYSECEQICCNGKLHLKSKNKQPFLCCGSLSYTEKDQVCCGGQVLPKYTCLNKWHNYESRCRGGKYIYQRYISQMRYPCYKGMIKCGKKFLWIGYGENCCNSSISYDPNRFECCKNHKIVEKFAKCGSKPYSKCEKKCCDGKLHSKSKSCCGSSSYNEKDQVCCGGQVYSKYMCWKNSNYRITCKTANNKKLGYYQPISRPCNKY